MAEGNEQVAQTPESSQELIITLELITPENEFDPALLNVVGHAAVVDLQQEGYTVLPSAYTGEKGGGSFLVELVTSVQNISMAAWNHRAALEEGVTDLSGLVTVFGGIVAVLKRTQKAHEKQVGKEESTVRPIKITATIAGAPLMIEAPDLTQADAALQLALKYQAVHPAKAAQMTPQSQAKVRVQVPARKRRARR
ncbi:MAG: hypothetical protein ACRDHZ_14845 [Ktedonobacteraceae bacterium]